MGTRPIRVIELFAGVGGFRVGFDRANGGLRKHLGHDAFEVVWSNQWEPGERSQHASRVYTHRWGPDNHPNLDIASVDASLIPDADLLVGGFPCQDYSVARTLNQATGIIGKKGVLWWEIHRLVREKRPSLLLLENVDRLLNSPAGQRGRDFAIILSTLNALGYDVEWRIINAAEYGFPQRRRRVFILAYGFGARAKGLVAEKGPWSWVLVEGLLARAFKCDSIDLQLPFLSSFSIDLDPVTVSESFNVDGEGRSPFKNAGIAIDGKIYTVRVRPAHKGRKQTLKHILLGDHKVPDEYRIPSREIRAWRFLKGAKSLARTKRNGVVYSYDEGAIPFPDPVEKPARTIVTGEGGKSPSRFKHVVRFGEKGYRRLTPVELERLNGFRSNHTKLPGISDARRAFFMGNALVTGIVTRIARKMVELDVLGDVDEPLRNNVENPWPLESLNGAANHGNVPSEADSRVAPP